MTNTKAALKQTQPARNNTRTDANTDTVNSISAKPDNKISASSAPVPNVCTEEHPNPVQQQQKNPQALNNTDEAQHTTGKLTTKNREKMNIKSNLQ